MPDEKTGADALRWYLTGATSDGGTQDDADASIGNHRSSHEIQQIAWDLWQMFEGLAVQQISGACGPGTAYIHAADEDSLKFTAPGEADSGLVQQILQGQVKTLESGSARSKYCRIYRWGNQPFKGIVPVQLSHWFNNAIGMENISDTERAAGEDKIRCICFKAEGTGGLENVNSWIKPLGSSFVSDVQQLPATGTGYVETSGTTEAIGKHGFLRIEDSGGSLKEIAFYSARHSSTKVQVTDASHRGLLGTSATAGAATDIVRPVPGLRIAYQAPSSQPSGYAYNASDENDIPSGLTWYTGIDRGDGPGLASLSYGNIYYLWLRLTFPACAGSSLVAFYQALNSISYDVTPYV